ncbi:MAG: glycosyltransferase family A protein [Rubricoccaceae bacterium]|nr:glycosyltransferase family A protein [Rubricoccaceae bacterium]
MPDRVPLVSIGLPVRNGSAYLAQAMDDLLGQTVEDVELVVCDNASTDDTAAIVRAAARRDPRVRYRRNPTDIGALPNANLAFHLSRGAYYVLAAHDDRHAPDFLERLVGALEARPDAILAYGRKGLIDDHGRRFRHDPARGLHAVGHRVVDYDGALERPLPDDPVARYHCALRSNDCNAPIHGLFRREVLARLPEHHVHGSDRLIVASAALWGPFAFVDAELMQYRVHAGSTRYLDRATRIARETGREDVLPLVHHHVATLQRYLRAVAAAPLTPTQRLRAYTATTLSGARRHALGALGQRLEGRPRRRFVGATADTPSRASASIGGGPSLSQHAS